MDKPLEIEYKFLIKYPDINILKKQSEYKSEEMCQMYLLLPQNLSEHSDRCRIRSVKDSQGTRYIKTFKESISDMTRIEIESEISQTEFMTLSAYIRKGFSPINKVRHSFRFGGFICEIDIFPFWQDKAYLEIEVDSEDTTPPIPDFIEVIKDVTADKRYRNTSLAQLLYKNEINTL